MKNNFILSFIILVLFAPSAVAQKNVSRIISKDCYGLLPTQIEKSGSRKMKSSYELLSDWVDLIKSPTHNTHRMKIYKMRELTSEEYTAFPPEGLGFRADGKKGDYLHYQILIGEHDAQHGVLTLFATLKPEYERKAVRSARHYHKGHSRITYRNVLVNVALHSVYTEHGISIETSQLFADAINAQTETHPYCVGKVD